MSWTPRIGDRVRVRLTEKQLCGCHEHYEEQNGAVGIVIKNPIPRNPFIIGHPHCVEFVAPVPYDIHFGRIPEITYGYLHGGFFAADELELLEEVKNG